jgi:transposase
VRRGAATVTYVDRYLRPANVRCGCRDGCVNRRRDWLATEPLEMRAGTDTILTRVVTVFGVARPQHAHLFAKKHSTRMKVLVYDKFGIRLAGRRLNKGRFVWTNGHEAIAVALNLEPLRPLVAGLPRQALTQELRSVGEVSAYFGERDRNWLKGALHAVLCGAGHNLRMILRARQSPGRPSLPMRGQTLSG